MEASGRRLSAPSRGRIKHITSRCGCVRSTEGIEGQRIVWRTKQGDQGGSRTKLIGRLSWTPCASNTNKRSSSSSRSASHESEPHTARARGGPDPIPVEKIGAAGTPISSISKLRKSYVVGPSNSWPTRFTRGGRGAAGKLQPNVHLWWRRSRKTTWLCDRVTHPRDASRMRICTSRTETFMTEYINCIATVRSTHSGRKYPMEVATCC